MVTERKAYFPGAITDEQYEAWQEYRQADGPLEIYQWIAAGMPDVTGITAANAWLDRLSQYLVSQIEQGFISEAEAKVIGRDMEARLFGSGTYAGKPQSVMELPSSIQTDVERYWTSLPAEAQKAAEQSVRERQAVAQQETLLPLGAGGNLAQQIGAGYNAIRQLQLQMSTAPYYMQNTIASQIKDLQSGISQLQETERTQAGVRTAQEEQRGVVEEPSPGDYARQFAEKYHMSPEAAVQTAIRYETSPDRGGFEGLTREEQSDLRFVVSEWQGQGEAEPEPTKPFELPTVKALGITGPPAYKSWFEQNYPSIAREFMGQSEGERTESNWSTYLEKERKRLKEEFARWSPYQRGERPGAFQPRIKTVAF